jgi:hypothetical protein
VSSDDGGYVPPESQAAFDNALRMMEFTHKATMEQMDKLLEIKRAELQMWKESRSNEISDSNTTT